MLNEKLKNKNGITLIALVVTIVVLLILAGVTIQMVFSDNGIIKRAQGAADAQKEVQDKDSLATMMAGYEVERLTSSKSLLDYFTEQKTKGDISNVTADGENGVIVTLNNGTQYKVNEDGTITPNKGISLSQTSFNIQLEEDEAGKIKEEVTKTLTASLTGIEGTIKWTSSDETVATVSPKEGTNVTVKALAKGTTTITASLADGTYPVTCTVTVTVKKPLAADEVAYTDSNGNKYGWEHINEFSASILSNANSVTTNNDGVMQATGTMNGNTVTIPVGTQMTVQVTQSGTKKAYKVRVLGFKYDDLTSGGKAGITFDFVDLLPSAKMNSSADNTEGWGGSSTDSNDGGCELRGTLNSTTLASLNNKDYIKAVNKTYYLGNKSTETRTKSDKLWLLACSEIWPQTSATDTHYAYAMGDETGGKGQYPLYKTLVGETAWNSNNSNLEKKLNNSANAWWLRSPYYTNSDYFCFVSSSGSCRYSYANYLYGVAPGFCI